jgi:hypothetical protein
MVLAPEHVLWTALRAADLHRERDTVFRFVTHQVVAFRVGRSPVRLFFESEDRHAAHDRSAPSVSDERVLECVG